MRSQPLWFHPWRKVRPWRAVNGSATGLQRPEAGINKYPWLRIHNHLFKISSGRNHFLVIKQSRPFDIDRATVRARPRHLFNSSWPSATYMRRDFQCLFPQRLRYVALISVLISPVPHTWGVTDGSLLASPPNSRRSPASLISPAPHICGASRTPILTRVVWKILNVVTNILVVLPDYRLP